MYDNKCLTETVCFLYRNPLSPRGGGSRAISGIVAGRRARARTVTRPVGHGTLGIVVDTTQRSARGHARQCTGYPVENQPTGCRARGPSQACQTVEGMPNLL